MFLGFRILFLVILFPNFIISIKFFQKLMIFSNFNFVKSFKIIFKNFKIVKNFNQILSKISKFLFSEWKALRTSPQTIQLPDSLKYLEEGSEDGSPPRILDVGSGDGLIALRMICEFLTALDLADYKII